MQTVKSKLKPLGAKGSVVIWAAISYQPFADLMLNDLQFVCSYLPTRWQQVDISQRCGISSAGLLAILVFLYPGRGKVVGRNVTAPLHYVTKITVAADWIM